MPTQSANVEELLEQTHWLRGLARGLVHGDEAEDVAQETMLTALQSPPPSNQPLRPWLARVATNVVRMSYRSKVRRERREKDFAEALEENRGEVLKRFELHNSIAQMVVGLPEPFRSTLLYRYLDERSCAEIATQEGIAAATVRWRIKRGLEMLRATLDKETDRRTWVLALQPCLEVPSKTATVGASAVKATAKGLIIMKASKVAAIAVAVVGLSWGGHLVTRTEPKAIAVESKPVNGEVGTTAQVGTDQSERTAVSKGPEQDARARKRKQLLAAIETARNARMARNEEVSSSQPTQQAQTPHTPALAPGVLDKDYIREQMDEILPLVKECYEQTLERRPNISGKAVVEFSIVGEEDVGGIIELSEFDPEASTIEDAEFSECIQETMYGLEFDPPQSGGRVVVKYPFEFRRVNDEDAAKE